MRMDFIESLLNLELTPTFRNPVKVNIHDIYNPLTAFVFRARLFVVP